MSFVTEGSVASGAVFDDARQYRYRLWRGKYEHADRRGGVVFIGINPSVANAVEDDPTIRRLRGFTTGWKWPDLGWTDATFTIVNLFAWIATQPGELCALERNRAVGGVAADEAIRLAVLDADLVVPCWGAVLPRLQWRIPVVAAIVRSAITEAAEGPKPRAVECRSFGLTKEGFPRHPLYLAKETALVPWSPEKPQ